MPRDRPGQPVPAIVAANSGFLARRAGESSVFNRKATSPPVVSTVTRRAARAPR